MKTEEWLEERVRAEDILLGSLGFGEEATVVTVQGDESGYHGLGRWPDGEEFEFYSEDEVDELQLWALQVLHQYGKAA